MFFRYLCLVFSLADEQSNTLDSKLKIQITSESEHNKLIPLKMTTFQIR